MELIQIYQTMGGIETTLTILAILVGIASVFVLCYGFADEDDTMKLIGGAMVLFILFVVAFAVMTPDPFVYTYNVTNWSDFDKLLQSGYHIYNQNGNIVDIIRN